MLYSSSFSSLTEMLKAICFSWKAQSIAVPILFLHNMSIIFPAIPSSIVPISFWDCYLNGALGSHISLIACLKTR